MHSLRFPTRSVRRLPDQSVGWLRRCCSSAPHLPPAACFSNAGQPHLVFSTFVPSGNSPLPYPTRAVLAATSHCPSVPASNNSLVDRRPPPQLPAASRPLSSPPTTSGACGRLFSRLLPSAFGLLRVICPVSSLHALKFVFSFGILGRRRRRWEAL
ncbi:hypothetical protein AXF42_Ash019643 [Apostasia shenzhenica]|uniref:Uncharacterized protein n=1 Tax=Apostasia shenzhenica TaxID=1088818 RepID=A0A2I0A3J7_9ASPA|nr:hypothetical protein AXF42_Ash019643 [Apostasia shenzhenica]